MKKLQALFLALCMVFTLAAPALAEGVLAEAPLTAPAAPAEGTDGRRMEGEPITCLLYTSRCV